jgi:6-phosphogluconolactonase
MLSYRVFDSAGELAVAAAQEVVWVAENCPGAVIALSGGSTPRPTYERLGSVCRERLSGRRITWVIGDERFVPADHSASNVRMVRETLFAGGLPDRHTLLWFDTGRSDPVLDFEEQWRRAGVQEVDLAVLGVGDDGHTASLFPGTPILEATGIAAEVTVPGIGRRFSLTLPVLRSARRKVILAVGGGKRPVISRIESGEPLPATLVLGEGEAAWWFVDRAAYPHGTAPG